MKKMKKIVSLLLAMVMVFAMTATAFAATANLDGHAYKAYQIFDGTQATGSSELGNITWGKNINSDEFLAKLQEKYDIYDNYTTAAQVAEVLSNYADSSPEAKNFAALAYEYITGDGTVCVNGETSLDAGYYLVVDTTETNGEENAVKNLALLQLTNKGTFVIANKTSIPEFQKKVQDINDTTGVKTEWQDSADYDIGDHVPFQLKGTVAENYGDYETYYFAFHDKEEAGLDFEVNSVKVYVDEVEITSGYRVVTEGLTDGCTFEVVFDNLKSITSVQAGSAITVEYTSTLTDAANIGAHGNVNKARLEFSNNPNNGKDDETGYTPWDNVIVFTYKVIVNKVDEDNEPLAGAEFTLSKIVKDGVPIEIAVVKSDAGTSFTFVGLDDGDYILSETTTPAGYNTIGDITFTVTANHDITWTTQNRDAVLTSLSGNAASGEITFTADNSAGSLTTSIVNQSGATLPETGGMGTTIFYVLGVILVLGAGVVLITKKRMA